MKRRRILAVRSALYAARNAGFITETERARADEPLMARLLYLALHRDDRAHRPNNQEPTVPTDTDTDHTYDLSVCLDCYMFLAGADDPDPQGTEALLRRYPPADGWRLSPGGSDPDADPDDEITDFSSRPCEGCGSRLGGSRHRAHAYR